MISLLLKALALALLGRAAHGARLGDRLEPQLGFRLLCDGRVSAGLKARCLMLGLGVLVVWEIATLPVQLALWGLLPALGMVIDSAIDGLELLIVPVVTASLILPWLAPRDLVEKLRMQGQPVRARVPVAHSRRR